MSSKEADWLRVPAELPRLYVKYAGDARRIWDDAETPPLLATEYGPVILIKWANQSPPMFWRGFGGASRALGGPNALTSALLGGALSSGLGYGAGWLMEKLLPRKYLERGKLRRNLAILGGLGGAGLSGWAHGGPLVQEHGVKGLLMAGPFGQPGYVERALQKASQAFNVTMTHDEQLEKAAELAGAFLPNIPVDHFNRQILTDPFTEAPVRAATAGLLAAASQAHGGAKLVSPFDVGRIAMGMGSGAVSGMLVGKVLGALAGLTPRAQEGIQRAGIMAGLLNNVVPSAFR